MKVFFNFNNFTKSKSFKRDFFLKCIKASLKSSAASKGSIFLSLNLVSLGQIRSLNKRYRRKDRPTDVLAFRYSFDGFFKKRPSGKIVRKGSAPTHRIELDELGDIVICPQVVKRQAKLLRLSLAEELAMLTVHGTLHLLGYDHERSPQKARVMFKLQDKILARPRLR